MTKRVGWESLWYIGTAGSQAATQITNKRALKYEVPVEYAKVTPGGAGSAIPIADHRPIELQPKLSSSMVYDDSDTALATLLAAAINTTPTPLAIYVKSVTGGRGFDGDCWVSFTVTLDHNGETVYEFNFTPTTAGGRTPNLNAT